MINVYRLEDEYGNGPYRERPMSLSVSFEDHPLPIEDGIEIVDEYICGFENVNKLLMWFKAQDRKYLHENEFFMVVYQSDDVLFGSKQVVFKKTTAKKQMTFSLCETA